MPLRAVIGQIVNTIVVASPLYYSQQWEPYFAKQGKTLVRIGEQQIRF